MCLYALYQLRFHSKSSENKIDADDIETFTLINPHGCGEDMETIMMDSISNQVYLVSKSNQTPLAYIYKVITSDI